MKETFLSPQDDNINMCKYKSSIEWSGRQNCENIEIQTAQFFLFKSSGLSPMGSATLYGKWRSKFLHLIFWKPCSCVLRMKIPSNALTTSSANIQFPRKNVLGFAEGAQPHVVVRIVSNKTSPRRSNQCTVDASFPSKSTSSKEFIRRVVWRTKLCHP